MRDAGLTRGEATPSVRTPAARVVRAIEVRGLVQGVGFRPFVWRLAAELGLEGSVINRAGQVEIVVSGSAEAAGAFARRGRVGRGSAGGGRGFGRRRVGGAPPGARVEAFEVMETDRSIEPGDGFSTQ